jgi:cobalt-precorrin 5A hydrolase
MNSFSGPVDIFSLTEASKELAVRLQELMPHASHHHLAKPFIETAQKAFINGNRCIFICSTGIVVRALAPVLKNKHHDPAVLVLDEQGEYVIPLLSGHEGGAGELAHDIAKALAAQCVITSATDYSRPVYTIGMGCDRGCPPEMLQSLLNNVRVELGEKVTFSALASIDLKADEAGLLELSQHLQLPLQTFSVEALGEVEDQLSVKSDIVFREVGVYGVAEAAALCAASKITGKPAELVINKQKNARATISVARSYAP